MKTVPPPKTPHPRKAPPQPQTRHILVVRSTSLRLADWQRDPSLVKQAYALHQSALFTAMLAVLRNESPMNYGLPHDATHDARIAHANQAAGYQLAINNLEALANLITPAAHLVSEFKPEFSATMDTLPAPAPQPLDRLP